MATQSISVDITLEADIEAIGLLTDYGVPGSPRWTEYTPEDWADRTIDIAGVTVAVKSLPRELLDALWECAIEGLDDGKWNEYEPEYD